MSGNQPLPQSPQDQNITTANNIAQGLGNAVRRQPAISAAVIQSLDPNNIPVATTVPDLTAKAQAVVDHQDSYNSGNLFQSTMNGVNDVAAVTAKTAGHIPVLSTLLSWVNKPLQELQKDYKFISAVYAKHGVGQGLLATLGVLGSATAGAVFSGGDPLGAIAGADAALVTERNLFGRIVPKYHDALMQSENPNYQVSFGRAFATGLSNIPGLGTLRDTQHGLGQFVSGTVDAGTDLELDPVIAGGKVSQGIKSGRFINDTFKGGSVEYAKDALGKLVFQTGDDGVNHLVPIATDSYAQSASGIQKWLIQRSGVSYSPQQLLDTYDLAKAQQSRGILANTLNMLPDQGNFARAADHIGTLKNPVEIAQQYPDLARQITKSVLGKLAKANTGREVAETLAQSLHSAEITDAGLGGTITNLTLPTRTFGRALAGTAMEKLRQSAGDTGITEERNLLVPKRVPVWEDVPVTDEEGKPKVDENGNPVTQKQIAVDAEGKQKTTYLQGGLLTNNWSNAIVGKLRTFTGYRPLSIDAKNLEQSGKEINLDAPDAGIAIFNMARYALPYKVAMEKAAKIVYEPNKVLQAQQYASLLKEIVKTAGIRDDSNVLDHVMSEAQRVTEKGSPAQNLYGVTWEGKPLGDMENKPTADIAGGEPNLPSDVKNYAIWSHQFGSNGIIDFKTLRNSVHSANGYSRLYMGADDFFTNFTEKIFAPLTLFTSGFGIRVAANEALHQVIRHGLGDYMENIIGNSGLKFANRAMLKAAATSATEALTDEDLDALGKGKAISKNSVIDFIKEKQDIANTLKMRHPFGAASYKIAKYLPEDKLNAIAKFQDQFGLTLPAGGSASHLAQGTLAAQEEIDQGIKKISHGKVPGQDTYTLFDRHDPNHERYWAQGLSKARNEETAQSIGKLYQETARRFPGADIETIWNKVTAQHVKDVQNPDLFKKTRADSVGMRSATPESFGGSQVAAFRGLVTGADGTVHDRLIQNIIDGKTSYSKDLKQIPLSSRPLKVIGRAVPPTTGNIMQKMIEQGYRTVINPVVNFISRDQIWAHYYYQNFQDLQPMVDSGLISAEDQVRFAAQKGVGQMIPLIHNPPLRSQFAMIHRNALPFYFAQEQALKRVGRLISTNPQAFRDFQMINQGMNNPGFVHTDSNGTKYIVYPLLGEFGNSVARGLNALGLKQFTGIPTSVTGSTQSLLSVLPELKLSSVGPFANLAITDLSKIFPTLDPAVNALTGGYPAQSWINTLMPNSSVRDLYNALTMDQQESMVHNSTLSAIAAAAFNGDIPDGANGTISYSQMTPADQQKILDKIEANARTNLFVKGLLSFFLPLSPTVSNDYYNKDLQTLRSEFINMTVPKSQGGLGLDLKTATAKFMDEYGARGAAYTVSATTSGSGGAELPLAQSTLDWLATNKSIMTTNPMGAAYLVPQVSGDANALKVDQKLLTMHLRETQTPKDFLNAIFVAKGWSDLASSFADYDKVQAQATQTGNRNLSYQATTVLKQVTADYGASNPIWYSAYSDPTKSQYAKTALSDLQTLSANNKLGTSPQVPGIQRLLDSYADYHALLLANTIDNGLKTTPAYSRIKSAWFDYLTQEIATHPELTNVVNGVFKKVT